MPEPYEIDSAPAAPELPGGVLVRPSVDDAVAAAAADLMMQAFACARKFGEFHLAIGPSHAAEELIVRLMTDPNYRDFPWARTHVWSAAEPRVAPEDERHSMSHLGAMLLHGSDLPDEQSHPLPAHLHDADALYHDELCGHLAQREPGHDRLDCVVLPATIQTLTGLDDPIGRLYGASPDDQSVSISARAVRGARLVMVLAPGEAARSTLEHFSVDHERLGVIPDGGQLRWYLDRRACGHENLE